MVITSYQKPYEKLKFYQNIVRVRRFTSKITEKFKNKDLRLFSQMRASARSAKQNIIEGYSMDSAKQFANFIKISLGSLEELKGDYNDCVEDKFISQKEHKQITNFISKTCYMIQKYLDKLYRLNRNGKWKKRYKSNQS